MSEKCYQKCRLQMVTIKWNWFVVKIFIKGASSNHHLKGNDRPNSEKKTHTHIIVKPIRQYVQRAQNL